jgi:hypothetical protein
MNKNFFKRIFVFFQLWTVKWEIIKRFSPIYSKREFLKYTLKRFKVYIQKVLEKIEMCIFVKNEYWEISEISRIIISSQLGAYY